MVRNGQGIAHLGIEHLELPLVVSAPRLVGFVGFAHFPVNATVPSLETPFIDQSEPVKPLASRAWRWPGDRRVIDS